MAMDLAQTVKDRHIQFSEIHSESKTAYADLQVAFSLQSTLVEEQKGAIVELKQQSHYWEAQFKKLKSHEAEWIEKVQEVEAKLRKREEQLFGRRSEKRTKAQDKAALNGVSFSIKKRGQQPGSKGHGKRNYDDLPQTHEEHDLPKDEKQCPCCKLAYEELAGTEDSKVLEIINIKAHQRVIHRKRYKRTCQCSGSTPKLLSAPVAAKLFPKSQFGVTIWAHILLQKYEYHLPLYRILKHLAGCNLSLAAGTVTEGLQKLIPILKPAYDGIVSRNLLSDHWHADETGWKVFEPIEGKKNNRWFMWLFQSADSVVFKICPSRSSQVLMDHFGKEHKGGTLSVDRYSAYKAIAKTESFILAFCWAHVRRDFLQHAKGYPHQEAWALGWVNRIAALYYINNQRVKFRKKSKSFRKLHQQLENKIKGMRTEIDEQLRDENLLPSAKKLIKSLDKHWDGLVIFVGEPQIPMDNNTAENGLRSPVIGRKGYYGSGAVWSSVLTAMTFSLLKTLKLWNINPHTWLLAYFQECAMGGGEPPDDISKFLPWNMTEKQKALFTKPPAYENTG